MKPLTKSSSAVGGVVVFSAIVSVGSSSSGINFSDCGFEYDICGEDICVASRNGLLEEGSDDICCCFCCRGCQSTLSKGEEGGFGKGDTARFRKGLFEDRLWLKPGDG